MRLTSRLDHARHVVRQCVVQIICEAEMTATLLTLGFYNIAWLGDECEVEYDGVQYTLGG